MSRVDALVDAARSPTAKLHELRLKYWNKDVDVICCFEGADDQEFFLPHVRRDLSLRSNCVDIVVCSGKSTVLALLAWSGELGWNPARLGFFVDRDLDSFLGVENTHPQLYVTEHYSIESHVVDDDYFDNIWQDLFRLSVTDERYQWWKDTYYKGAVTLAAALRPLMQLALATKLAGGKVDFGRVKLNELVSIRPDAQLCRRPRRLSFAYSDVVFGIEPSRESFRSARRAIAHSDYRTWLRGKYLLWYSTAFFARMKTSLTARGQANRAVVRFQFSDDSAATCLCSRTSRHPMLTEFLTSWAHRIVAGGSAPDGIPA